MNWYRKAQEEDPLMDEAVQEFSSPQPPLLFKNIGGVLFVHKPLIEKLFSNEGLKVISIKVDSWGREIFIYPEGSEMPDIKMWEALNSIASKIKTNPSVENATSCQSGQGASLHITVRNNVKVHLDNGSEKFSCSCPEKCWRVPRKAV